MDNILIVSSSEKGKILINELLTANILPQITNISNGSKARRLLIENHSFDLIIINTPLKDEFGHDLALYAAEVTSSGIILIVKSELSDEVSSKVEDYGIFVLSKPISRQLFYQAVKMASTFRKRLLGLKKENFKLQQKIEEIRLIDRAKCILIQYLNMTESQAHYYIEKQAMDMRCNKREIAERILQTYEN